jgi:hypothetical protein
VRIRSATIAALSRWANEDPKANAERGQAGLRRKFYDQTDPSLTESERQRRADVLYRLHFQRMAHDREKARQLAREAAEAAGGT